MTPNPILQALAQQLQDNLGNRLTTALCDGLLLFMNQAILAQQPPPAAPVESPPGGDAS